MDMYALHDKIILTGSEEELPLSTLRDIHNLLELNLPRGAFDAPLSYELLAGDDVMVQVTSSESGMMLVGAHLLREWLTASGADFRCINT
ncbi:hypothetical protein ACSFCT_09315 [Yokenella regensburgei]|uniref:hypothetical protein n=1 Tax=Yokenella regensburgei TaxID=158877 RepID=UPI003EDAC561